MAIFLVVALGNSASTIDAAMKEKFPTDSVYQIESGKWLVNAELPTSRGVSDKLDIPSAPTGCSSIWILRTRCALRLGMVGCCEIDKNSMTETGKSSRPPRSTVPTTPEGYPTTPPLLPSGDYSYTLEIVMNMQHTLGKLTEAVESLKSATKTHGEKLEKIGNDVHAAKVVVSVVGALLLGAIALIGWVAKTYLDYLAAAPHKP